MRVVQSVWSSFLYICHHNLYAFTMVSFIAHAQIAEKHVVSIVHLVLCGTMSNKEMESDGTWYESPVKANVLPESPPCPPVKKRKISLPAKLKDHHMDAVVDGNRNLNIILFCRFHKLDKFR